MTQVNAGGEGTVQFVVWPPYAGAVNSAGQEPMFGLEYKRGQIWWDVGEDDVLRGHTQIQVPAGEWTWIIYCNNQFEPGFVTCRKLAHPLVLDQPGVIDLMGITGDEVNPINPQMILRD